MLISMLLTACGSGQTSTSSDKEEVTNQQTDIEEEAEQPTTIEEIAETSAESTPEPTAEPTPEPTPEPTAEPVEMVSWEEWASQPGEEPRLVVWNEEKGKQQIIEPRTKYTIEEGDRLAVSFSMPHESEYDVGDVYIRSENTGDSARLETVTTEYGTYWNVIISEEGVSDIYYKFNDEKYMYYIVKE